MTDEGELDARLRAQFEGMRTQDARRAPAFESMLAGARAAAATAPAPTRVTPGTWAPAWSRTRLVTWGGPLLIAAGLGAIWIIPERMREREFERAVSEWSRREATMHSPTDGLLTVPGSEFLGRVPSLGGPATGRGS